MPNVSKKRAGKAQDAAANVYGQPELNTEDRQAPPTASSVQEDQNATAGVNEQPELDTEDFQAPSTAPSVLEDFDLDDFRAPNPTPLAVPVDGGIDVVRVEKPRATDFVFIHPTWRDYIYVIPDDFKKRREAHLIFPNVAALNPRVCRRVFLVPYVSEDSNYYLWPILLEDHRGKTSSFSQSALRQVEKGAGRWCMFEANMGNSSYNLYTAAQPRESPNWPPEGMIFLIKKAFEDRVIRTNDHALLTQLRGNLVPGS